MGWISVGLLVVSGGCILYRHPPTSFIHRLLDSLLQWKGSHALSPDPPTPLAAGGNSVRRKEDEQSRPDKPLSPKIPTVTLVSNDTATKVGPSPSAPMPPKILTPNEWALGTTGRSGPQTGEPPRLKPPTFSAMPPPPRPSPGAPLRPPPSAASSLRVPPTKNIPNAAFAPSRLSAAPAKSSRQVTLSPGHSPLDWAALTSDPDNKLRGKDAPADRLIRVPPSQLKLQNGRRDRDAWTVYQGKVYNITPYLPFHPGGPGELMRGAGRDAAKLFMEVHPWVNWEAMLGECVVGILVGEEDVQEGDDERVGQLDEMD